MSQEVGQWLVDQGVYTLNGVLWAAYWLQDHLTLLAALACAVLIMGVFDRQVQRAAHARLLRHGRGETSARGWEMRVTQLLTGLGLVLWTGAASSYQTPVPELGALMWGGAVLLLALLPAEREALQWRLKGMLISYALLLLALRWYLDVVNSVDARAWAATLGSVDEAQRVLAQNRSIFETIAVWTTWFGVPFSFAAYAVQRLWTNRLSLEAPFRRAEDLIEAIRTRGEPR